MCLGCLFVAMDDILFSGSIENVVLIWVSWIIFLIFYHSMKCNSIRFFKFEERDMLTFFIKKYCSLFGNHEITIRIIVDERVSNIFHRSILCISLEDSIVRLEIISSRQ